MNIEDIENHQWLPECLRESPTKDYKAMRWVIESIMAIDTGNYKRNIQFRQKALEGYTKAFNAKVELPRHQQENARLRAANVRLRAFLDRCNGNQTAELDLKR